MRPVLLALLAVATCRTPSDVAEPAAADWVRHVPTIGWEEIPGYSVALPPGVKRLHAQGIDSAVALFEGEGLKIGFDYGMYGGLPGCEPQLRCRTATMTIDGRTAQTISIEGSEHLEAPYRDAFHIEIPVQPRDIPIGEVFRPGINLTMHAQCVDAEACELARSIAATIDFGEFSQATPQPPPPPASPQPAASLPAAPEPERVCQRVTEAEARSFDELELMSAIGNTRVYGRRGQMLCSEPDAGGSGECEIVGRSRLRIEFPTGASGFHTSGAEPIIFRYQVGREGVNFSCRPRSGASATG